jgi:hypothetical protein
MIRIQYQSRYNYNHDDGKTGDAKLKMLVCKTMALGATLDWFAIYAKSEQIG